MMTESMKKVWYAVPYLCFLGLLLFDTYNGTFPTLENLSFDILFFLFVCEFQRFIDKTFRAPPITIIRGR